MLEWDGAEGEKPPVPLLKNMFANERRKAKVKDMQVWLMYMYSVQRAVQHQPQASCTVANGVHCVTCAGAELQHCVWQDGARSQQGLQDQPG